jgi:hypothetical protein
MAACAGPFSTTLLGSVYDEAGTGRVVGLLAPLEQLAAPSLADHLAWLGPASSGRRLTDGQLWSWSLQLALGLCRVHAAGRVLLDLQPNSVRLSGRGGGELRIAGAHLPWAVAVAAATGPA